MIFDRFAQLIEKHAPEHIHLLNQAKLFVFPGRAHEVLPKTFTDEDVNFLRETFFLPFDVIAVEDSASCVLIRDEVPGQQGFGKVRHFMECLPLDAPVSEFREGQNQKMELIDSVTRSPYRDVYAISTGRINSIIVGGKDDGYRMNGDIFGTIVLNQNRVLLSAAQVERHVQAGEMRQNEATLKNFMTALEEVAYFNTPNRFVVEKRFVKHQHVAKGRVARSHQRENYVLLTPDEIRTTLIPHDAQSTGITRAPHERRRHMRLLASEKFTHMRGKSIVIPASWIGPSERVIGNKRYRVMLDL
jgi:hypothetical protein